MKLLLTSDGFTNQAISDALFELVGKKPEDTSLAFVPTAANSELGDKDWLIDHYIQLKNFNFKSTAIVDIAAVSEDIWRPQFENADVLLFGGGDTHYLMEQINQSGLRQLLPDMLQTKVYVGISAGSMVTAPDLDLKLLKELYDEKTQDQSMPGLGFIDYYVLPHLNNPHFNIRTESKLHTIMQHVTRKTYALDDQSALKVIDGSIEHIGSGKCLEFN